LIVAQPYSSHLIAFLFHLHKKIVVADDLGFGDLSLTGMSNVRTPHIDDLYEKGLRMTRYYGQPVCSPSRAAIQSGRLPLAYGLQTYVIDPNGVDYGLDLNETTLPQLLRDKGGYATHAIGKWHLGMGRWEQTPTFRGYDSFHGFYSGGQDYFSHEDDGRDSYDMHIDNGRNCGRGCSQVDWAARGVYTTHLFTSSAVELIASHDTSTPLFLYLAYQAVHSPDQVPQSYIDPYNSTISDPKRRTFAGMLSCLDEAVGNVTSALAAAGMEDNTLLVFVADNGGPIFCVNGPCGDATGTSNYPLRGGKHTLWEGGTRLTALVSGPMVHSRGVNESGLMHHADWLPTLLEAAGVEYQPSPGFALHGASQWQMITAGAPSSRNETVTNIDPLQPAIGGGGIPPGSGNAAIVTADGWKLLLGLTGPPDSWSPPNASKIQQQKGDEEEWIPSARPTNAPLSCNASSFLPGVCFPGFSLPGAVNPTKAVSPGDCCAHCASLAGCTAWTFRVGVKQCWVKNGVPAAPSKDSDCVSAGGNAPPPAFSVWPLKNMTAQLFQLMNDPWEREDVAALHPDIVEALTARLAQWGIHARDPYYRTAKKTGNATKFPQGWAWVPWMD